MNALASICKSTLQLLIDNTCFCCRGSFGAIEIAREDLIYSSRLDSNIESVKLCACCYEIANVHNLRKGPDITVLAQEQITPGTEVLDVEPVLETEEILNVEDIQEPESFTPSEYIEELPRAANE